MDAPVMVEIVTNPLKMDNPSTSKNNNNNDINGATGFPFDDSDFGSDNRDRGDGTFRSHLDDLVKRHPELAEHLSFDEKFDKFPFRSNTWGHKRRGSASAGDNKPSSSSEYPEGRRFARPFGSRFEEKFGFPSFNRTFDGEPQYQQQEKKSQPQQNQSQAQPQQQTRPQQQQPQQQNELPKQEPQQNKPSQQEDKPPQVPSSDRSRKQNSNIPQSSTVDLGQKQDPVDDTARGQRSMSAPPENRTGQQRFVSSINIPIQSDIGSDMNAQHHQQQQPQQPQWQQQQQPRQQQQQPPQQPQQQSRGGERVIPIHVEGRDEPVMPKPSGQTFTQQPPPPPQPERVFGQRPSGFGSWGRPESPYYGDSQFFPGEQQYFDSNPQFFMNRGEPHHPRMNADEFFANPPGSFKHPQQQQQQYQKPQQQHPQQQKPAQQQPQQQHPPQQQPQQQQTAPPQQQQQQQQQQQVPPPQPPPPKGPIDQIHQIQRNVLELMNQVERFNGKPKDKQYLYLDEMLTRNLLKLDDVETEGKETIRQARKEAINCIQRCISILEAKAAANEQLRHELMDVDAKLDAPLAAPAAETTEANPITNLEISGVSRSGTQVMADVSGTENQPPASGESVQETATPMEVAAPAENAQPTETEAPAVVPVPEGEVTKEEETVAAETEVKEGEQAKGETKEQTAEIAENKEQPAEGAENASQTAEATKEEVKDKKEKKKVKKKEKGTDKAEKK